MSTAGVSTGGEKTKYIFAGRDAGGTRFINLHQCSVRQLVKSFWKIVHHSLPESLLTITNNEGIINSETIVENTNPMITVIASGLRISIPSPMLRAIGRSAKIVVNVVIKIGLNRLSPALSTAFTAEPSRR